MYYDHKRKNGKNSSAYYYLPGLLRFYGPAWHLRKLLKKKLASIEKRPDRDYIIDRVNYYNKLSPGADLGANPSRLSNLSVIKGKSTYVLDTQEYSRWFPKKLRWNCRFGDVTQVPEVPAIVKSRPINGDNANSVLMNLDKKRHFIFLDDKHRFDEKENRCIFRGKIDDKPNRILFMEQFFGHSKVEAMALMAKSEEFQKWNTMEQMTLWYHLKYKYIMALEGNDVASNLKWVMSSNSVAVSPKMVYETWFMEGRLVPGKHFIEVKPDFSDLLEKLEYYDAHPEEAQAIARNANEYVEQFLDPERETLISLAVLDKYFTMTGQR